MESQRILLIVLALTLVFYVGLQTPTDAVQGNRPDPGFTPISNTTFDAPDIWIDNERNGFGTYYGGVNADNLPIGSGDRLWVNEPNRVYARVRNFGAAVANNLTITFYARQPAVIGDPNLWQQIGRVQRFGPVQPRSFRDTFIEWTPLTDIPASIKVVIDPISNDANPANNSVIESSSFMDVDFATGEATFDFVVHNSTSRGETFEFTATIVPVSSGGQAPEPYADVEQVSGWSVQLTPQTKYLRAGGECTVNARVSVDPCHSPAQAALYASAYPESGGGFFGGIGSIPLNFRVAYHSLLTVDCSAGERGLITGRLFFAPEEFLLCRQPPASLLANQLISLRYFPPSGRSILRSVRTTGDGTFSDQFTPNEQGTWTVRADYDGAQASWLLEEAVSFCTFQVGDSGCTPPTITCPANVSVSSNTPTMVTYPAPTVTSNCPVTTTCTPPSGSTFPVGTTTVTCTTTDSAGNTATCSFTVTVSMEPCAISCPADVTASTSPDQCGATVNYPAPTTTGNCGAVTCTPASGSFFPVGATNVTCTATDGPTCSFTVTVNDTTPPTITCPPDVVLQAPDCTVIYDQLATATDNCDANVTITSDPPLPATLGIGVNVITYTAMDNAGNIAMCTTTVTVVDMVPPLITCPGDGHDITLVADQPDCAAIFDQPATATDNCDADVTITSDPPLPATLPLGQNQVTFTATDDSGNIAMCTVIVEVVNPNAPTADAGPDQYVQGQAPVTVTLDGTGSSDPDGQGITYQWTQTAGEVVELDDPTSPTPSFSVSVSGQFIFQLIVTDACGVASVADTVFIGVTVN